MKRIRRVRDGGDLRMLGYESAAVLAVGTAAAYAERMHIYDRLTRTGVLTHRHLATFAPQNGTFAGMRVAILAGLLLSLPVVSYLACARLLPNAGRLDPMLLAVPLLGLLGAAVGWLVVLPHLAHPEVSGINYLPPGRTYADLAMETLVASAAALSAIGAVILKRAG